MNRPSVVLDASSLLAALFREPGAAIVARHLSDAVMSAVNLSESAARIVERGAPMETAATFLSRQGLRIIPFDQEQAYLAASLRVATRHLGLSLGDWACLALGLQRRLPVVTADRSWEGCGIGVEVVTIR